MSLLSALSISASGMSAQRQRTELLVENLANSDTTRTPEGGPYRRKDAVFISDPEVGQFSSLFESESGSSTSGVRVADVVTDMREPDKRYLPGHPDADKDGYVAYPRAESRRRHGRSVGSFARLSSQCIRNVGG